MRSLSDLPRQSRVSTALPSAQTSDSESCFIPLSAYARSVIARRDVLRFLAGTGLIPLFPLLGSRWGGYARAGTNWASGGTVAMTGKPSYPDPFESNPGPCLIVASTTEGPCTTQTDLVREDVSEGWTGLPVRLALKIVDEACNPVPGVVVSIWHTNREGSYSGQTPSRICLLNQAYASANFFRGVQTTAADGTVFFDTCFPGWYPGRAVHIHFQVKDASRSYRVSQVFFPEDVTEDIFADHPDYSEFGQPDTTFANDGVFRGIPAAERERNILTVERMTDGAMLASRVLTVVEQAPVTPGVTPQSTATASPVPTQEPTGCRGDCDGGGSVTVDEVVRGVNIALGDADVGSCNAADVNFDTLVTVDEIVTAVNTALNGCG